MRSFAHETYSGIRAPMSSQLRSCIRKPLRNSPVKSASRREFLVTGLVLPATASTPSDAKAFWNCRKRSGLYAALRANHAG